MARSHDGWDGQGSGFPAKGLVLKMDRVKRGGSDWPQILSILPPAIRVL